MDIEYLVRRAQAGDANAIATLADQYRYHFWKYAYRKLKNRQKAEDALQEAFALAFSKLDEVDDPANFERWLFGIVRKCCVRMIEHEKHERTAKIQAQVAAEDTEQIVFGALASERIADAICLLPSDQRQMVLLHYFDELTMRQIANAMGLTVSKVRMRLRTARKTLRSRLGEEFDFPKPKPPRKTARGHLLPRARAQSLLWLKP